MLALVFVPSLAQTLAKAVKLAPLLVPTLTLEPSLILATAHRPYHIASIS